MPRESAIPIDLPSLDDLFTTQAERDEVGCEKVGVIPLYMIDPFPDHPFRVDDDALRDMAESVSRFGVLVPALVRPKENGRYEMVSGHRRKRAAEMAGLEALPAVVREMTYDEAVIAMVDANIQRACEATLDMGQHLIRRDRLGVPQSARDVFALLAQAGCIELALAQGLQRMVGFRNIAVHDYKALQLPITVAIIEKHLDEFLQYSKVLLQRDAS